MGSIKIRLEKLEAASPAQGHERVTEIHRVIVGRFNPDGTPVTIIRRCQSGPAC
jgi:hypothetical protein